MHTALAKHRKVTKQDKSFSPNFYCAKKHINIIINEEEEEGCDGVGTPFVMLGSHFYGKQASLTNVFLGKNHSGKLHRALDSSEGVFWGLKFMASNNWTLAFRPSMMTPCRPKGSERQQLS